MLKLKKTLVKDYMVLRIANCTTADGEDCNRNTDIQHQLLFTPPYHPELQPIERVWCCVKNEIARNPVFSVTEMNDRWTNFVTLVTEKVLLSTYRKSMEWEQTYRNGEEEDEFDDAAGSDIDEVSDDDEPCETEDVQESAGESEEECRGVRGGVRQRVGGRG